MEFLMYYASFATAGGVVSTWSLWRPAMNFIRENNPVEFTRIQRKTADYFFLRRIRASPPRPRRAAEDGSGTADTRTELTMARSLDCGLRLNT